MINCEFENGAQANLRHATVDTVLHDGNGKVLLTLRAERLVEGGKWAVPGGFLDRDETAEQAAVREVLEETGYRCEEVELLDVDSNPNRRNDDRQNVTFWYLAKAGDKVSEADDESTAQEWFALDELPSPEDFAFDHGEGLARFRHRVPQSG